MDSNINSDVSSFANKEVVKLEMLDIIVNIYKEEDGCTLSSNAKDFILDRTEQLLDYYDVGARVKATSFLLEDGTWSEPHVHIKVIDELFEDYREKMSAIFLQLISYDLAKFIVDDEEK